MMHGTNCLRKPLGKSHTNESRKHSTTDQYHDLRDGNVKSLH
jgi:hypothetical protein